MNAPAKPNKVLITGASGFIGSHLTDELLHRGCEVHCLVRKSSDLEWLDTTRLHLHTLDLRQPDIDWSFLENIDTVFHCAGLTKAKTRQEYFLVNAESCRPFYKALVEHGQNLKCVVHLSSLAAVGPGEPGQTIDENTPCNPITYYGKSKLAGEQIAQEFASSLPMIILRPPVVYGPREKNFFLYLKSIRQGWCIRVGTTQRYLSLIHSSDLVAAMITASEGEIMPDNIYFVTDGNIYTWDDVSQLAMQSLQIKARIFTLSEKNLKRAAMLSEAVAGFMQKTALLDRQRVLDICQSSWTASPQKFFDRFDFKPQFDLAHGLPHTLEWYQQQRWL
jgi:nucleoside-diphosphate-sugar epimerase